MRQITKFLLFTVLAIIFSSCEKSEYILEFGQELKGYVTEQEWEDIHITEGTWVTSACYLYSEDSKRWVKMNLSESVGFPVSSYIFSPDGIVNPSTSHLEWRFNASDSTLTIGLASYKVIDFEADKLYIFESDDYGATPKILVLVRKYL